MSLKLSNEKPTRTGYEFLGWSVNNTAANPQYDPGSNFTINAKTTLYAVWRIKTINCGGPTINGYITDTDIYDDVNPVGRYQLFTWMVFENNDTDIYIHAIEIHPQQSIISYDANGGIGAPESQEKTYKEDLALSPIKPI